MDSMNFQRKIVCIETGIVSRKAVSRLRNRFVYPITTLLSRSIANRNANSTKTNRSVSTAPRPGNLAMNFSA